MRPKLFIGSSTKGRPIAELIQEELSHDADCVVWSQGTFRDVNVPIENLMAAIETYDFAVFVLLPEDHTDNRGQQALAVRDNVIFELGLFLGKLGRARNFSIAPTSAQDVVSRLSSDLSGITPSKYNPTANPLQASVGAALLQAKQAIRDYTKILAAQKVIYDTSDVLRPFDFRSQGGSFWKDNKPSSPKGTGVVNYMPDGVIELLRTNNEGRFEIELRQDGLQSPSIPKSQKPPRRILHVTCEAKVDTGEHPVRFVLKNIMTDKWAADQMRTVANTDWQVLDMYFDVASRINSRMSCVR